MNDVYRQLGLAQQFVCDRLRKCPVIQVGPNVKGAARPVVNYVASGTITSMDFDLKAFIDDASKYGIQSSWYLTDVFGGFEIWNGPIAGLKIEDFCVEVH